MPEDLERLSYVEDEPDIRAITRICLAEIGGYELEVCASGQEALKRLPLFKPQLIILDVMMPGMDGIETMRRLRTLPGLKSTPIVFMTAKVLRDEVAEYRTLGAADVIAKPFDPMTLAERVAAIWRKSQETSKH